MQWPGDYWNTTPSDYSDVPTEDWRKCQVEGCHKKHAFTRSDGDRKLYSKYCAVHTCAKKYPREEGLHCANPRNRGDAYCSDHMKCNEPGCDKMGEYFGVGEWIPWFCIRHRCAAPDCRSRATDRQQQRCSTHLMTSKCSVPGCTRLSYLHRDGRLDTVCAVHYGTSRCAWEHCTHRTSSRVRYCPAHKCVVDDCTDGRRSAAADACLKHVCSTPSCPNATAYPSSPRSRHCARHTCKAPACVLPALAHGDFCADHTCATPNCRLQAHGSGSLLCPRHACVVAGCARPRLGADPASTLGVGVDMDRCYVHAGNPFGGGTYRQTQTGEARSGGRRRAVSWDGDSLDSEEWRAREGERQRDRERSKRWSDDLGAAARARARERERERERAALEGLQRDMDVWTGRRYSGWEAWEDGQFF